MKKKGFTLIELLIVVAIIAILAAIAIPNFLEAQVRAKVARSKSDLRTLAVALESYVVDWNKSSPDGDDYLTPSGASDAGMRWSPTAEFNRQSDLVNSVAAPFVTTPNNQPGGRIYYYRTYKCWAVLTTPVSYMNSILIEPYSSFIPYGRNDNSTSVADPPYMVLTSCGPDRTIICSNFTNPNSSQTTNMAERHQNETVNPGTSIRAMNNIYDPTNGTLSYGEVYRFAAIKNASSITNAYGTLLPITMP